MNNKNRFNDILICLQDLRDNKMIIVPDRKDRENEADIITQGNITPKMMNWIASNAKGLICCPTTKEIARKAGLSKMANFPILSDDTPFTISIDANETTTGISAFDRAITVNKLATGNATINDFKVPGHMFPLIANDHLLKARDGHTEATVTLMKLAGLNETGVCCEIMSDDGHMMESSQINLLSKKWNLNAVSIDQIKDYYYFSQILLDVVSFDKDKLVTIDKYSNINYELLFVNKNNDKNTTYNVLVINEFDDIEKNIKQSDNVSNKLKNNNEPTIIIDLKQLDLEKSWYVINSILKIAKISHVNCSLLSHQLKDTFKLCDIEIVG